MIFLNSYCLKTCIYFGFFLIPFPVYPQKQQPYGAGPYGYAAYPGPYYAGSQYALPYNQY